MSAEVSSALISQAGVRLHSQVVEALGALIVSQAFGPGALLPNEEDLCLRFAVSRTAVREAIKVLGAKGMLEARPRAGTRVRPLTQWSLFDADVLRWLSSQGMAAELSPHLTAMREIIEPAAAAQAALAHTAAQLLVIEQAYADMAAAVQIEQWVLADLRFHQSILQATNNPFLVSLGGMIGSALEVLLVVNARQARHFNEALPWHWKVLAGIRDRDAERANLWMRALLADTHEPEMEC